MVSQSTDDPPDPAQIVGLLSSRISVSALKLLPSTLQLWGHLQLLSERIRREATRALAIHAELIGRMEEDEVPEDLWISLGALKTSEGKTLRRIKEEGMGEEDVPREDVMMELSFSLRLMHLGLLLATKGTKPEGRLRDLLDTYFPPDLTSPLTISPRDVQAEEAWQRTAREHKMCYIRAMTPHQGRVMALHRQAAEAMFEMLHRSIVETTPRPTWYDLMPEKTRKADEEMDSTRQDVMAIAEGILRDKKIIDDIFASPRQGDKHVEYDQGQDGLAEPREHQGIVADHGEDLPEDGRETDGEGISRHDGLRASSSKRKLVDNDSASESHSPPRLRAGITPSPARDAPSASYRPIISSHHVRLQQTASSPGKKKAPRRSGLPPPEGPDYTAPLPSSPYTKKDLRPFEMDRLSHAGQTPERVKRPRVSDGHEAGEGYRVNAKKILGGTLD